MEKGTIAQNAESIGPSDPIPTQLHIFIYINSDKLIKKLCLEVSRLQNAFLNKVWKKLIFFEKIEKLAKV